MNRSMFCAKMKFIPGVLLIVRTVEQITNGRIISSRIRMITLQYNLLMQDEDANHWSL